MFDPLLTLCLYGSCTPWSLPRFRKDLQQYLTGESLSLELLLCLGEACWAGLRSRSSSLSKLSWYMGESRENVSSSSDRTPSSEPLAVRKSCRWLVLTGVELKSLDADAGQLGSLRPDMTSRCLLQQTQRRHMRMFCLFTIVTSTSQRSTINNQLMFKCSCKQLVYTVSKVALTLAHNGN